MGARERRNMWNRHVEDIQLNIQKLIAKPGKRCYWWALGSEASIVFFIGNWQMEMKLPLPRLVRVWESRWNPSTREKKQNEEEIARVRSIWNKMHTILKEKLERVNSGESIMEKEFKDGIAIEGGYGLKARLVEMKKGKK